MVNPQTLAAELNCRGTLKSLAAESLSAETLPEPLENNTPEGKKKEIFFPKNVPK